MLKNLCILCLLLAGVLAVTGESCFLSNKSVEVPLRGEADMDFGSFGTVDADVDTIDFFEKIQDIEDEGGEVDTLVSLAVENVYWRLVENRGDPSTTITGSVNVQRQGGGGPIALVAPTTVNLATVGTAFSPVPLEQAGLDLLLDGFDEYVAYRNGTGPQPNLTYYFTWNSSSSPAADFSWAVRVKFTLTGIFEVEVPDLWD